MTNRTRRAALVLTLALAAPACADNTPEPFVPGTSTELADGALVSDPVSGDLYVFREDSDGANHYQALFRLDVGTGQGSFFADLTGPGETGLVVSERGPVIMRQLTTTELSIFDREGALLEEGDAGVKMRELLASPSRQLLAAHDDGGIHIVVPDSLEVHSATPTSGTVGSAVWAKHSDRLYAVVFENETARILGWDVTAIASADFAVDPTSGLWPSPEVDITLPGAPSSRAVPPAVSADDGTIAFAMAIETPGAGLSDGTVMLRTADQTVHELQSFWGPYQFTGDSGWLVGQTLVDDWTKHSILAASATNGSVTPIATVKERPVYLADPVGDAVLFNRDDSTARIDLSTQATTSAPHDAYVFDYVLAGREEAAAYELSRDGTVKRINFKDGSVTPLNLSFEAGNMVWTEDGRLAMTQRSSSLVHLVNPQSSAIDVTYDIAIR